MARDNQYSDIRPEDLDYAMSYRDVVNKLKADKVEPVAFTNDLFQEDDAKTYAANKVLFTIEHGHLVYMQTMGVQY